MNLLELIEKHKLRSDRYLMHLVLLELQLLNFKIDSLMTKEEFIAFAGTIKAEIGTVSDKVDALESKINNSPTEVDPDIVAAFQDVKSSLDSLSTKADNTPVSAPVTSDPGGDAAAAATSNS